MTPQPAAEGLLLDQPLEEAFATFNQLFDRLSSSYQGLEQQVASLKSELAARRVQSRLDDQPIECLLGPLDPVLCCLPVAVIVVDASGCVAVCNPQAEIWLGDLKPGAKWSQIERSSLIASPQFPNHFQTRDGGMLLIGSQRTLGDAEERVLVLAPLGQAEDLDRRLSRSTEQSDGLQAMFGLAHQIRSPLTSAALYASQLKQCDDAKRRETLCTRLMEGIASINSQVEELLQMAEGAGGSETEFSLQAFISTLTRVCSEDTQNSGSHVELQFHSNVPDLVCRGKQNALLGAIQNLIQNAAQAGSTTVNCHLSVENDRVLVRVRDDGRGRDLAQMEALFAAYQSTRSGGTGLGLTMARQIARAHGGDLRCTASSPKGSEFLMQWPILGVLACAQPDQSISLNRIRSEV